MTEPLPHGRGAGQGMAPMVMRISAANLYDYLTGNWHRPAEPAEAMGSVATRLPGDER